MKIVLNSEFGKRIRWDGFDTARSHHWIAYGNTLEEIWNVTVKFGINHYEDEEAYILNKIGKDVNDYWTEDDDYLEVAYYADMASVNMNDDDYFNLLKQCDANAYYSTITIKEYPEV